MTDLTKDQIFQRLLKIFGKLLKVKDKSIRRESRLRDDLGLDSVDLLDFSVMLEGEFEIDIGDYEATWVNTVEDVLQLVEGKVSGEKN